jgi:glycosyltransferase involved in cell wall biosynthesis
MENKPKISVIMAFHNSSRFIKDAVESILNQSFSDFELIIINDASNDDSDIIVANYFSDKRIVYIKNEERKNKSFNLNLGIKLAKSEIIAIMDGDDISEINRFEEQYNFLIKQPDIAVVGSYLQIIDANNNIVDKRTKLIDPEEIKKNILTYSPVQQPSVMFRKKVIVDVGGYNEKYYYRQDIDLWMRVVSSGYKISNIPKFLFRYRHYENSTSNNRLKGAMFYFQIQNEIIKNFNLKVKLGQYIIMYLQLLIGLLFSARHKQIIEGIYKKIIYGRK